MAMASELDRFEEQRQAMVDSQLRPNAVNDANVVRAMSIVPRETFLPADLAKVAYADLKLPIGGGRTANPPIATGRLLSEVGLREDDRVLVVGAAGGYAAAVLAGLVSHVTALETSSDLAAAARDNLASHANVTVAEGPLEQGWAAGAPYTLILIDGAVEQVPQALVEQLTDQGRLASGLIDRGVCRLSVGRRTAGGFGMIDFADIDCAHLPGFAPKREFVF